MEDDDFLDSIQLPDIAALRGGQAALRGLQAQAPRNAALANATLRGNAAGLAQAMPYDENQAKLKLFDEIQDFARGRMGRDLKARYAPPPPPAAPAAPAEGELDPDSLAALEAAAGDDPTED